jgi:hypothetical protein
MMVTAILAVVLGGTTAYLVSMSNSITSEMSQSVLEINGTRALDNLVDELLDGFVSSPTPGAGSDLASSFVQIKQPADLSRDGSLIDEFDASGNFNGWGVRAPWRRLEQPANYTGPPYGEAGNFECRFVAHPDAAKATVSEVTLDYDINGDTKKDAVFVRGLLVREWNGTTRAPLARNFLWDVLQVETGPGNYGGDIDGDGTDDPIFSMAAGSKVLTISVWLYGRDGRRHIIHNARTSVALRNQPD